MVGPAGSDALGATWRAAMQQHHVGVLGADAVERRPNALVIVAIGAAGESDAGAGGHEALPAGLIAFPGSGISANLADKARKMGIAVWRFGPEGGA